MSAHGNLADPDYEPSDEELAELMRGAFHGLVEAREESLKAMGERIDRLQVEARAQFEARRAPRS
jgi:hypothetical protein